MFLPGSRVDPIHSQPREDSASTPPLSEKEQGFIGFLFLLDRGSDRGHFLDGRQGLRV